MERNERVFLIRSLIFISLLTLLWIIVGIKTFPYFGLLILVGFCFSTLFYLISTSEISEKRKYLFIRLLIIIPLFIGVILLILKRKIKSSAEIILLAIIIWTIFLAIFTKPKLVKEPKSFTDFEGLKIKSLSDFLWFLTVLLILLFLLLLGLGLIRF
ncbi:MAG: hypothetical protein ABIK78_02380 [candidate division WOR-3 bacterium]